MSQEQNTRRSPFSPSPERVSDWQVALFRVQLQGCLLYPVVLLSPPWGLPGHRVDRHQAGGLERKTKTTVCHGAVEGHRVGLQLAQLTWAPLLLAKVITFTYKQGQKVFQGEGKTALVNGPQSRPQSAPTPAWQLLLYPDSAS